MSSANDSPIEHSVPADDGAVPVAEVREQLQRIFSSEPFRRSRRLHRFLSFITELALQGREEEINEHLIGIEVFERGAGYNPSEDSVVRRQAHTLRRKLDEYYASEGASDRVRIEVPLGHYVPVFRYRTAERANVSSEEAPIRPAATKPTRRRRLYPVVAVSALALAAFLIGRTTSERPPASSRANPLAAGPVLGELWGPWFEADRGPLICLSSPLTGVVKHFDEPLPPDAQPRRLELTGRLADEFRASYGVTGGKLYISPSVTEAKSGEALGVIHLANLFSGNGLAARGALSLQLSWEVFKRENVIVLGHAEQNQWVAPLLENYPLQLRNTHGAKPRRIVNVSPREGEGRKFMIDYPEDPLEPTVEYALVSMLPGLDARHQILLISGLNTQATLMGVEFLTDPERVETLLAAMRQQVPDHRGPWRFQLVLRAEVHGKVPTGGSVELIRVLE